MHKHELLLPWIIISWMETHAARSLDVWAIICHSQVQQMQFCVQIGPYVDSASPLTPCATFDGSTSCPHHPWATFSQLPSGEEDALRICRSDLFPTSALLCTVCMQMQSLGPQTCLQGLRKGTLVDRSVYMIFWPFLSIEVWHQCDTEHISVWRLPSHHSWHCPRYLREGKDRKLSTCSQHFLIVSPP